MIIYLNQKDLKVFIHQNVSVNIL